MLAGNSRYGFISRMVIFFMLTVVFAVFLITTRSFKENSLQLQSGMIEETVKKYLVQCYASEGIYPEELGYLADNYGLIIDTENYIYHYQPVSSNIMPDIRVYVRKKGDREEVIDF